MVDTAEKLVRIIKNHNKEVQKQELIQMALEAVAKENDNDIMNELLIDLINKNALLNRELQEQLIEIKRLSITDQLTGLYNRRHFIEVLGNEYRREVRYGHKFSIIMFDIDHFKNVNDTYGHDIGDFVLKELSSIVKSRLREYDVLCRWGGEEFMILLPETGAEQSYEVAEVIRKLIEKHNFLPVPKVTSSFGVITHSENDGLNIKDLTTFVDQALYEAKDTGRNKVIVYKRE